jgi:TolB-like protein
MPGPVLRPEHRQRANRSAMDLTVCAPAGTVWAERYHRTLEDIFALQDELTISVVWRASPPAACGRSGGGGKATS